MQIPYLVPCLFINMLNLHFENTLQFFSFWVYILKQYYVRSNVEVLGYKIPIFTDV